MNLLLIVLLALLIPALATYLPAPQRWDEDGSN
jgi:hypothetical protein